MSLAEKLMALAGKDRHDTDEIAPGFIPMVPQELRMIRERIDDTVWDTFRPVNRNEFCFFSSRDGTSRFDTNVSSGYMPFERFFVTAVSAEIVPLYAKIISKEALADVQRISDGFVEIVINNTIYNTIPFSMILRSSVIASNPDPKMPSTCSYCSAPITNPGLNRCDYCGAVYLNPVSRPSMERDVNHPKFTLKNNCVLVMGTSFYGRAYWPKAASGENDLGIRLYLHGVKERTIQ